MPKRKDYFLDVPGVTSQAFVDCFGILEDDDIRRYFELGCEVKALGRGHIQRIKEEVRSSREMVTA